MKVYIAAGLFTIGQRITNELIYDKLKSKIPNLEIYLPQKNEAINSKENFADSVMIFRVDYAELSNSDFLIAVLDDMDHGMLVELGIMFEQGKRIFALASDIRTQGRDNKQKYEAFLKDPFELQWQYFNLFAIGAIKESGGGIYTNVDDLVQVVKQYVEGESK
jgi:nucleoside 2-deoxyribosyltransferase